MAAIIEEEFVKYVSARTGSGAMLLTEYYMVGNDETSEEYFVAVKPIEVISLGYYQDENNEIHENLIYRKYIRFSDDIECPITDVETVSKLAPSAEEYYLLKSKELYPEEEETITDEIKDKVNVIIGNFAKSNKKLH
jgi:hypothetical protein